MYCVFRFPTKPFNFAPHSTTPALAHCRRHCNAWTVKQCRTFRCGLIVSFVALKTRSFSLLMAGGESTVIAIWNSLGKRARRSYHQVNNCSSTSSITCGLCWGGRGFRHCVIERHALKKQCRCQFRRNSYRSTLFRRRGNQK